MVAVAMGPHTKAELTSLCHHLAKSMISLWVPFRFGALFLAGGQRGRGYQLVRSWPNDGSARVCWDRVSDPWNLLHSFQWRPRYEFANTDWLTMVLAHSHLFLFFPLLGSLGLVAFYLPSVAFAHLYWTHLPGG